MFSHKSTCWPSEALDTNLDDEIREAYTYKNPNVFLATLGELFFFFWKIDMQGIEKINHYISQPGAPWGIKNLKNRILRKLKPIQVE